MVEGLKPKAKLPTLEELKAKRLALLAERKTLNKKLENSESEAKEVFDLIFHKRFKAGGAWLDRTKRIGRRDKLVRNLLGGARHLFSHLHVERSAHSAADRRAPNSVIQGPASNLGFVGGYFARKLVWDLFESKGVSLGYFQCNAVHDSTEAECRCVNIPLIDYLCTHAYSTLIHQWMRDFIGFETSISFEMDCAIGPSLAEMQNATRWDTQVAAIRKGLEWKRDNLKSLLPINQIMKIVEHNADIVFRLRKREILEQLRRNESVSYTMEMTQANCMSYGLVFEQPEPPAEKLREDSWRRELKR